MNTLIPLLIIGHLALDSGFSGRNPPPAAPEAPPTQTVTRRQAGSPCSYQRTLQNRGVRAELVVPPDEACSTGTIQITILFPDGRTQTFQQERDGIVSNTWLTDLKNDGLLDLVICTTSAASGSYGEARVYTETGEAFAPRTLALLNPSQRTGYMGHDLFEVKDQELYRTFPIYRPSDSNARPTGGVARFRYSFSADGWIKEDDGVKSCLLIMPQRLC